MSDIAARFAEFANPALREDLLAEVTLVDRFLQDDLIDALQFREGEFFWEEFVTDGRPLDLVAQTPDGIIENPFMIEREFSAGFRVED